MFAVDITLILVQRLWQAGSGLVTMLLIAHFLSPEQQGWYYSFLSFASLYTLFDLGLSVVLLQISAHLFVGLRWLPGGGAEGAGLERFWALVGRSTRFYVLLALMFILLVLPSGLLFFGAKSEAAPLPSEQWLFAWILLVLITALNVLVLPYLAVVEGSGRVQEVYAVRLAQGVFGSLACWLILATGGGLWATVVVPSVGVVVVLLWLGTTRPAMFQAGLRHTGKELVWRREIWPLQWRVGLSWMCGYLLTQIYTPILFSVQGPVVAGQMGFSLTIANMLALLAQSWITRRIPAMAQAAKKQDWESMDRLFQRDFIWSIAAFLGGAGIICALHLLLSTTSYSCRLLPFGPFAGLLGVTLIGHVNSTLAAQLRSFRREPFVWVTVAGSFVTVVGALWMAGKYGAGGVVFVMLGVQFFFIFPLTFILWSRYNRAWRMESAI